MDLSKGSILKIVGWLFIPYIMLLVFILKNAERLKSPDRKLGLQLVAAFAWTAIVINSLSDGGLPKPKAPEPPAVKAPDKPPANPTASPATPQKAQAPGETEQKEPPLSKGENPPVEEKAPAEEEKETAPAQDEKPVVVDVEPACGDMAKKASSFWHVADPEKPEPCGSEPSEEFALIEWKKCAKEKAGEIKKIEADWKKTRRFKIVSPSGIKLGKYNEKKSAFSVTWKGIQYGGSGEHEVALNRAKAIDPYKRPGDRSVGLHEWSVKDYEVFIPVPVKEGKVFKERHKAETKLFGKDKYFLGACISYHVGKTKNDKRIVRNADYFEGMPASEKKIDMGAGKITMTKDLEVLVWSIPDNRILLDTAAE